MSGRVALVVATLVALSGPMLVLVAFGSAGGGERERPHAGLLETGVGCLDEYEYRRETTVPAVSCPDIPPAGLRTEYRMAWIGLAIGLVGAAFVVVVAALRSTPSRFAYAILACVAGTQLIAAAAIALASIDLDFVSGGSGLRPSDAFDRIAFWLFVVALALVPFGALVRSVSAAARRGAARSAN